MARFLSVSTEVFAAIWGKRQPGEETEDAILRRILECGPAPADEPSPVPMATASLGVRDERNGVDFVEGFEIFRNYKQREYRARAQAGAWARLDNGQRYPTINQLNSSIAAGVENVWNGNWKYRARDGAVKSIAELRRG
jgi:hypothetical protein